MQVRRSKTVYALTMTAAAAAVLGVVGPWAIPVGPVPLSLCTLFLYLVGWVLEPKRASAAAAVYVLMGTAGLPVFAGFAGGLGHLTGPTGGFVVGYIPLAAIGTGFVRGFSRRWMHFLGMVLGTVVLYAVGTLWFCVQTGAGPMSALVVCVAPFLPGDLIKMLAALLLGPALHSRLERSGLLRK